ncbi:MAG: hypothetical protein GY943_27065 [Chloroflexi bacterium]|nr:hypothetical protein [Chloroflexota bacterium]
MDSNPTEMPNISIDDPQFDSLRTLLLQKEWERIQALEQETKSLEHSSQAQIDTLQSELNNLQATLQVQQEYADALQSRIDQLKQQLRDESEALEPRLIDKMGSIITRTIQNSRDEMANALGPVMSEAIRVQIRDSRTSMIDTLYPIILETVQRAIAAFTREFQQNIDARLKSTFGPFGWLRRLSANLRGVSQSELALRDALPFDIQEMFLIQRESGLLISHVPVSDSSTQDTDLVGGMLTAIRDFTQDSFGDGSTEQELDEVQYGEERIIIQGGQFSYLATVIKGVEPSGFRTRLREFVAELHIQYAAQLRDYVGDPAIIPEELPAQIKSLAVEMTGSETAVPRTLSRAEKRILWGGGLAGIILLLFACFYLQFTIALLPIAFSSPTPTASMTPTYTPTPTHTATPTFSPTPIPTDTRTPVPTDTPAPIDTQTPIPTDTPTAVPTNTPQPTATTLSETNAPVWVRDFPEKAYPLGQVIPAGTAVNILGQFGEWVFIEWETEENTQQGWIVTQWVFLTGSSSIKSITPVPITPIISPTEPVEIEEEG